MARTLKQRIGFAALCLTPALILFAGAELAVRALGLARPSLRSLPLPEESIGLLRPDPDLFWSMRPNVSVSWELFSATTNGLGLRGHEVEPKQAGEFRILSLGESTTFGYGVGDDETYSARLEGFLRRRWPTRPVTVINAGVSAYSSFQSLKYLELRGLKLRPDLVLFYHEVNDYLPSTLRDSSNTEIGALETDRQLYESRVQGLHRRLLDISALYRFLSYRLAYRKVMAFDRGAFENPVRAIGLPDIGIAPRLARLDERGPAPVGVNERSLGRRVSETERREILERLADVCLRAGVALIVIHPAYRETQRHECLLTTVCRERGVTLFEAFDSLHPPRNPPGGLYLDGWHPNRRGHLQLALDLAGFIAQRFPNGATGSGASSPATSTDRIGP